MCSTNNHQAKCPLLLLHDGLAHRCASGSSCLVLALDAAEFLRVGQNEVHMSVVGEHLANELSRVLQGHAHPVVDVTGHLAELVGRHLDDEMRGYECSSFGLFKNCLCVFDKAAVPQPRRRCSASWEA